MTNPVAPNISEFSLMQAKRIFAALVLTLATTVAAFGNTAPAGAATTVTFSGDIAGSTVNVASSFVAPSSGQGNYIVDTEIYGQSGNRVAQFVETVWLGTNANVRNYTWNTAGLPHGTYRVSQGVFTSDWSANRTWINNAGSVTLSATNEQGWKLSSNVSGSGNVGISSRFSAPARFNGANVILDTEIYGPSGTKVAQWTETLWFAGGQTTSRSYNWSTTGKQNGTYTVKQGVFGQNWVGTHAWKGDGAQFTVAQATIPPTTTTTMVPKPTTTTTTTSAPKPTTTTAPSTWLLESNTSGASTVVISSTFSAPSGFSGRNVVLDTELYGPNGNKVAQWDETLWMGPGQKMSRNYSWSTSGKQTGNYMVKQGVFGQNWQGTLAWKGDGARFDVDAPVASERPGSVGNLVQAPAANDSHPFWVDPSNPATRQAKDWASSRPADSALIKRIADGGAAVWLGGWNSNVQTDVANVVESAATVGKTPVFVAYNIPNRDCGSYSAGGLNGGDAYGKWIGSIANGIGDKKAWVVLEPDALSQLDCLDSNSRSARLEMLRNAVNALEAKPNVDVYIDAGHPGWHSASEMTNRLRSAGVDRARGFSLNVSNFSSTNDNATYGEAIAKLLGGKKYIVDTSRNGNGSNGQWCNPAGRAVGATPTTNTGMANADAYLWIKRPGESDGTCGGGPGAGQWWADYALGLAQRAWSR